MFRKDDGHPIISIECANDLDRLGPLFINESISKSFASVGGCAASDLSNIKITQFNAQSLLAHFTHIHLLL